MMNHMTIDPSLDVPLERVRELVAYHAVPGETVRVTQGMKFAGEDPAHAAARHARFADRELVVRELRIDRTEAGQVLNYRFDGEEGLHNAKAFENPEGFVHHYGVVIQREGETWFVPFADLDKGPGEALRVAPVMTRCGHHSFGIPDDMLAAYGHQGHGDRPDVETFLAEHDEKPTSGEYALAPLGDGTWRLDASPWMCPASQTEVGMAEEAIAQARSLPSP